MVRKLLLNRSNDISVRTLLNSRYKYHSEKDGIFLLPKNNSTLILACVKLELLFYRALNCVSMTQLIGENALVKYTKFISFLQVARGDQRELLHTFYRKYVTPL